MFGIANNAVSSSGTVTILNNSESSNVYLSANVVFVLGNLF